MKRMYVVVVHTDDNVLLFEAAFPTFEKAAIAITHDVVDCRADGDGSIPTKEEILLSMITYGRRQSPTRWVYAPPYMEGDRYVVSTISLEE